MSGSGQTTLPDVREWSGDHPRCPGVVGRTAGCPGVVEVPYGYSGVVGRPSRMSESGWNALPDVREWSGGPPKCPGEVRRPSKMSGNGGEALPNVWQ